MFTAKVNGRNLERFNDVNISLKFDSVASTFGLQYYYDPNENPFFNFGGYESIELYSDGDLILTGTVLSMSHSDSSQKKLSTISGYSKPGVLEDCQIPTSSYPLQRTGLTLRQLCSELCSVFGLSLVVDPDVVSASNGVIDNTAADASQSVKSYLSTLASHRNVILSHTNKGELLLTRAKARQSPIYDLTDRVYTDASIVFDGQSMHSDITAIKQASVSGGNAGESTIKNPYVRVGVFRPKVIVVDTGNDNTTDSSVRRELANEVSSIELTVTLSSWYLGGKLILPNNTLLIEAIDLGLFGKVKWFIEEVTFTGNETSQITTIKCVLPESYNGQVATVNSLV